MIEYACELIKMWVGTVASSVDSVPASGLRVDSLNSGGSDTSTPFKGALMLLIRDSGASVPRVLRI